MSDQGQDNGNSNVARRVLMGAGLAVTGIASLVLVLFGLSRKKEPEPIPSPSGKRLLTTGVNHDKQDPAKYLRVTVDIKDADGRPLHHEATPVQQLENWTARWASDDEIHIEVDGSARYVLKRESGDMWVGRMQDVAQTQSAEAKT